MNQENQIYFSGKNYKILSIEQEFIVHPAAIGLLPLTKAALQCTFSCSFHIENYHIFLDKLILNNNDPTAGMKTESIEKQFEFEHCMISYNGTILIGTDLIKDFSLKGNKQACFSYQNVIEMVFEDGSLITTIDQNKAVQRIRKNLELGLRSLTKSRDVRCIRRFMSSAFIGDYKAFRLPASRMKYLQDLKNDYDNKKIMIKS